jgi:hypothetical protein
MAILVRAHRNKLSEQRFPAFEPARKPEVIRERHNPPEGHRCPFEGGSLIAPAGNTPRALCPNIARRQKLRWRK